MKLTLIDERGNNYDWDGEVQTEFEATDDGDGEVIADFSDCGTFEIHWDYIIPVYPVTNILKRNTRNKECFRRRYMK